MFFCIIEEESTQDNSYTGNVFMENSHNEPKYIEVRGACVHNLKNVNVNVPLHQIVGIADVAGTVLQMYHRYVFYGIFFGLKLDGA